YPADGSLGRPEIFVTGTRNPFRMAIDPDTGRVFWGDVGPDAFVDTARGPRGFDEINFADKPGNYGWPRCIGFNQPYADYDYETEEIGPLFSCDEYEPALLAYDYTHIDYPALGRAFAATDEIRTGRTAIAGVVYRPPTGPAPFALPEVLHGRLLMTEWTRNLIVSVEVSEAGELGEVRRVVPWETFASPIDLEIAPDGALYVLEYGTQFGGDNSDAGLSRVEYSEDGALTPVARITASETSAEAAPLTVQFSGAASTAPNDEVTAWEWDFDGDGEIDARGAEVEHTFPEEGIFPVSLTVRSQSGGRSFLASQQILVGNSPPAVTIHRPPEGTIALPGTRILLAGTAVDAEDGPIPCEDLVWAIRLGHNSHSHPVAEIQGQCRAQFTPDVAGHEESENLFYVLELTVKEHKSGKETGLLGKAMRVLPMAEVESPSGDAPRSGGPGHP
ncbi:MAG: PKD domain-containing protein, partial [Myxococcota bacterium]